MFTVLAFVTFATVASESVWPTYYKALVQINPDPLTPGTTLVHGTCVINQLFGKPAYIRLQLCGLPPNTEHGWHFHTFGNVLPSCEAAGTHFNPKNQTHGDPLSSIRHVGDRGNFMSNYYGCVDKVVSDPLISLYGDNSIMNRSLVIHSNRDDLNYKTQTITPTGNSGPKIACGVVEEYRSLE